MKRANLVGAAMLAVLLGLVAWVDAFPTRPTAARTGNFTFTSNGASTSGAPLTLTQGTALEALNTNASTNIFGVSNDNGSTFLLRVNSLGQVFVSSGLESAYVENPSVGGVTIYGSTNTPRILGTGTSAATGIAAGSGAGTSPTIAAAGTDLAFTVTLTAGSTPGASATIWTYTFTDGTFGAAPHCTVSGANAATVGLASTIWYYSSANTAATTVRVDSGAVGLTGTTAYRWEVICIK